MQAGDPYHEVECAWMAKELLRTAYSADTLEEARRRLVGFCEWAADVEVPEVIRLASTISSWEDEVLAYWITGRLSNARTEAMNPT